MIKNIKYLFVLIPFFYIGMYLFYKYYQKNYKSNVFIDTLLYIPTGSNYEDVKKRIQNKIIDYKHFISIAESFGYKNNIKPGKYKLNQGESNQSIIHKLIKGHQEPVQLQIHTFDHISEISEIIRMNFEIDSIKINSAIKKQTSEDGFSDIDAIKIYFIPGKYTFLWNDSAEKIIYTMKNIYKSFWNYDRQNKARELRLTPIEVINLAAITQRESYCTDEQPKIAGLYFNRYETQMKLQSDPTVLFAKKKRGFHRKYYRVYYEDLSIDSPYNTYQNIGLPPLPICSPNPKAIDAVLNLEKHEHIFMCASVERIGYHNFTKNYAEHEKNAERYRNYLNKKNIR